MGGKQRIVCFGFGVGHEWAMEPTFHPVVGGGGGGGSVVVMVMVSRDTKVGSFHDCSSMCSTAPCSRADMTREARDLSLLSCRKWLFVYPRKNPSY